MSGGQALERGYRRLLTFYPGWHRHVHGEEMIGVLLAAAPGDRRRPGLAEAVNIIWAGLTIRFRPRSAALPTGAWPDALAVFSVAAPVALTCQVLAWAGESRLTNPVGLAAAVAFYGLGLALPLVLLRLRRVAALISLPAAVSLAALSIRYRYGGGLAEPFAFSLFCYAAETAALLGSAGPRRGLQLLTWRAWALTVVAGACGGLAWLAFSLATFAVAPHSPPHLLLHVRGMLIAGVVAAVVAGAIAAWVATRSELGRRVLLLFAFPLYVLLINSTEFLTGKIVVLALLAIIPPLAAAGFGVRYIRRSRRPSTDGEPA